jgi:hypothetical protein
MHYGIDKNEFLITKNKKIFMSVLNIPIYESAKLGIFGYKYHDVLIGCSFLSMYLKAGVLM